MFPDTRYQPDGDSLPPVDPGLVHQSIPLPGPLAGYSHCSSLSTSPSGPTSGGPRYSVSSSPPAYQQPRSILGSRPPTDRSCTDLLWLVLFVLCIVGMLVIAALAFANGAPRRLLYGTDFLGNTCGQNANQNEPTDAELAQFAGNDAWNARKFVWYPLPSARLSGGSSGLNLTTTDASTQMAKLGVCVRACPAFSGDVNRPSKFTSYTSHVDWAVVYRSAPVLRRCVPVKTDDWYLKLSSPQIEVLNDFAKTLRDTQLLPRIFAELLASTSVLILCGVLAIILGVLVYFILRAATKLFLILMIAALWVVLLAVGWWLVFQAEAVDSDARMSDELYSRVLRGIGYAFFCLCGGYLLVVMYLWRRVHIAAETLQLAACVITRVRSLILIPLTLAILTVGLTVWCLLVWTYLQSAAKLETAKIPLLAQTNGTVSFLAHDRAKDWLSLYYLVAYIWVAEWACAMCFMVSAVVTVMWYFSSIGESKFVQYYAVTSAMSCVLRYHLGSLALGSLATTLFGSLRMMLLHIVAAIRRMVAPSPSSQQNSCVYLGSASVERWLRKLSGSPYAMCSVQPASFGESGTLATTLLSAYLPPVGADGLVVDWILLIVRLSLTILNVMVGYFLLAYTKLCHGTEEDPCITQGLLPLLLIALFTWMIAGLFCEVFAAVVHTINVAYCCDRDRNDGSLNRPYHYNTPIANVVTCLRQFHEQPSAT